jgi:hypothetical protein
MAHIDNVVNNILSPGDATMFLFKSSLVGGSAGAKKEFEALGGLQTYKIDDPRLTSDAIATSIIDKMLLRAANTPLEVGWAVRRVHFLFLYLKPEVRLDAFTWVLINYFKDIPVFTSPEKVGERSQLAFGSVFWGVETARQLKTNKITHAGIGNDEETILSVVGVHYSFIKLLASMEDDEPSKGWITSALSDIFMTNDPLRREFSALYRAMMKTNIIRGNSTFVLIGILLDSFADSSFPRYRNTLIAYDACIKNVYVPWLFL